jgi:hypothetical protein
MFLYPILETAVPSFVVRVGAVISDDDVTVGDWRSTVVHFCFVKTASQIHAAAVFDHLQCARQLLFLGSPVFDVDLRNGVERRTARCVKEQLPRVCFTTLAASRSNLVRHLLWGALALLPLGSEQDTLLAPLISAAFFKKRISAAL